MRILIAGAGRVGIALARYLRAENHDIIVIDEDGRKLKNIDDQIDILTIEGNVALPSVLKAAGAEEADMFLAVTDSDETNIVSSLVAKSVFNIPKRIARIGTAEYLDKSYTPFLKALAFEVVLSPEEESAKQIMQVIGITNAIDVAYLAESKITFLCLRCVKGSLLNGISKNALEKITHGTEFKLLAVSRKGKFIFKPSSFYIGDDIYFTIKTSELDNLLENLGYENLPLESVVILGGGKVGSRLAKMLEVSDVRDVTLVEKNKRTAISLAQELPNTFVMCGDCLDESFDGEVNLQNYKFAVTTTQSDESNVLLALLAKRKGIKRTCSVIRHPVYERMLSGLGIDATIDPSSIMVSSVLKHVRKGWVKNDYFIQSGLGEILEIDVLRTSKITTKPLGSINFPEGILIVAVLRNNELIDITPKTIIQPRDQVVIFVQQGKAQMLEKYFSVTFSFFK